MIVISVVKEWSTYTAKLCSRNDSKPTVYERVFKPVHVCLGLHIAVMITSNDVSQEVLQSIDRGEGGTCKNLDRDAGAILGV